MDIWSFDKLFIFLAFVIPGFVSIKFYSLNVSGSQGDASKQLFDAVSYSAINYALCIPLILFAENANLKSHSLFWYSFFYFFIVFICPLIICFLWIKLRESPILKRFISIHPNGSPWDFCFAKGIASAECWAKVTLKNGEVIGGLYGVNSFASSSPYPQMIYLEQVWILKKNGEFDRQVTRTGGVLVMPEQISHIEFRTT